MDRALNREILRLSIPSILANLTVPLVGFVDTAVAGHLSGGPGATFIGAISLGAMLFNLLYWGFAFLRTGTGGLCAQAFGRADMHECATTLVRSIAMALGISAVLLLLQLPFVKVVLGCVNGSQEVEALARQYFLIRVWAAPATLSLMAFSGWFVGMQDSMSSMWKDFVVNGVNVVASIALSFGVGSWKGLGFAGVAMGTVVAQYSGLLFCVLVCAFKYGKRVFGSVVMADFRVIFERSLMRGYFRMNFHLFLRSVGFIGIYIGYTVIAAGFGDLLLSCSSIMMQMLMIFSYFTDGFAYAGEALTGRFIGAGDQVMKKRSIQYTFAWSMSIAVLFIGVYWAAGVPLLRLLTDDATVVDACREFLPYLALMPPIGCAAFTWDGIYMGATRARELGASMLGAAACFFLVWIIGRLAFSVEGQPAMHLLLGAYFAHLLFRTIYMSAVWKRQPQNRASA